MAVDAETEAAELAEHRRPLRFRIRGAGAGIDVDVMHVADLHVVPAAGAVDQPARVVFLDPFGDAHGVELAPALVEDHPHDDARMIVPAVDHALELELELLGRFGVRLISPLTGATPRVAARHVLPDQQAELVAPVIPALRLDLDVLARQVEAEFLGDLDVVLERFIGRRGVEAVGPETLIERADLEDGLPLSRMRVMPLSSLPISILRMPK